MPDYSTGKDKATVTNRKGREAIHDSTHSIPEPLLPAEERKILAHHFPDVSSTSMVKGWAVAGTIQSALNTIRPLFSLPFRIFVFAFHIVDSALSYLRYPLLGMVILSFMYDYLSDVYPHELDGTGNTGPDPRTLTITITTKVMKIETSTLEEMTDDTLDASLADNSVKLSSSVTVSEIRSALETDSDSASPVSGQAKIATEALSSGVSSISRSSTPLESGAAEVERSTAVWNERVADGSSSLSPGTARSTTQKKRMYE
ncbi:hypothetical protein IFR04_004487 [Cadophora malorum]|uniref:Uncharacterized protein n=1 Tax=Cadophora malorum TaxID=108018 RepID=A0A8H7WCK4_9HELO|nr:hypothetical protein IFR04_004487 [Cadophora malorum]